MTVAELIKRLSKYDRNLSVQVAASWGFVYLSVREDDIEYGEIAIPNAEPTIEDECDASEQDIY